MVIEGHSRPSLLDLRALAWLWVYFSHLRCIHISPEFHTNSIKRVLWYFYQQLKDPLN